MKKQIVIHKQGKYARKKRNAPIKSPNSRSLQCNCKTSLRYALQLHNRRCGDPLVAMCQPFGSAHRERGIRIRNFELGNYRRII
jgi:hypothetical protein